MVRRIREGRGAPAGAGAISPSSTAPAPRGGPSRRSCGRRPSPTRWWAAPGSTTGGKCRSARVPAADAQPPGLGQPAAGAQRAARGHRGAGLQRLLALRRGPGAGPVGRPGARERTRGPAGPRPPTGPGRSTRTCGGPMRRWTGSRAVAAAVERLLQDSGYLAYLRRRTGARRSAGPRCVESLHRRHARVRAALAGRRPERLPGPPRPVEGQEDGDGGDVVKLQTIHSAKGLEYPVGLRRGHGAGLLAPPAGPGRGQTWRRSGGSATWPSPGPGRSCT